ncbi:MAG TPA: hydrogenase maturation nickel metallochaperone HypA [Phycisphaerae bacterium]|jgi:hydrogenase nickel incorporation protein HypA/HybF
MHELSIAMSLLEAAEEQSRSREGARIAAIHLKIGPLSGVVPKALVGAFELAREGTEFQNCSLMIQEIPVTIHCPKCRSRQTVASIQQMACPLCGTLTSDIITGRELEVCAMEIVQ